MEVFDLKETSERPTVLLMRLGIKGTVSRYKQPDVTIFKSILNQPQMVMNVDAMHAQCT